MGLRDYLPRLINTRTASGTGVRLSRPVTYVGGSTGQGAGYGLTGQGPRVTAADALGSNATFYRAVQTITNPLAALDVGVRRAAPDGTSVLDLTHPMALLWNRSPNSLVSAYVYKSIIWQQLESAGEAFVYVDRGESGAGPATDLWNIFHPVNVIAAKDIAGQIDGYVVNVAGQKVPLLPSEVLWLRYPHPSNPWGCQAPWRAASWAAELDQLARGWQLGEYVNGARPEGIFYLGDIDEATHSATVEAWRSRHVGARNALKHLFVSGSSETQPTYTRVGLTATEMSYIESRKVNAEEIMLAMGVHPDLLRGGATFENQAAAKVNLWTETLVPKLEAVSSEADRQLLPSELESFEFDTSEVSALQDDQDSKIKRVQQLMYVDTLLVDEARDMVGLEALPDGRGLLTLTAFRQNELDSLPAAVAERLVAAEDAARFALSIGADVPPRVPVRRTVRARPGTRVVAVSAEHIQKLYDRHEARGVKAVKALAEKQRKAVLRKLDKARAATGVRVGVDDVFDTAFWTSETRDLLESFMSGVWDAGAMTTAGALGISFDVFDQAVTEAMSARLDVLADQVTGTTRQAIESELLLVGAEAGDSVPDLAKRLTSVFDTLGKSRAETIARTETVGGYNAASRQAAKVSGVTTHRQWLAANDSRVRESHRDLHEYETQGMDDPYPNGVMFPGDPHGRAEETIQCRCVELFAVADD